MLCTFSLSLLFAEPTSYCTYVHASVCVWMTYHVLFGGEQVGGSYHGNSGRVNILISVLCHVPGGGGGGVSLIAETWLS